MCMRRFQTIRVAPRASRVVIDAQKYTIHDWDCVTRRFVRAVAAIVDTLARTATLPTTPTRA
jgi:hypothetical protein